MSYAYRYRLPPDLSSEQKKRLESLALRTARSASAVESGRFRNGWRVRTTNTHLIVSTNVVYAHYVELGMGYNAHNRFKVRDALNKIGLEQFFERTAADGISPRAVEEVTAEDQFQQDLIALSNLSIPELRERYSEALLNRIVEVPEPVSTKVTSDIARLSIPQLRQQYLVPKDLMPKLPRIPRNRAAMIAALLVLLAQRQEEQATEESNEQER